MAARGRKPKSKTKRKAAKPARSKRKAVKPVRSKRKVVSRKPVRRKSPPKKLKTVRAKAKARETKRKVSRSKAKRGLSVARGKRKSKKRVVKKKAVQKRYGKLSGDHVKEIRRWYRHKFNPNGYKKVPTEQQVIEFGQDRGISKFREYRSTWDGLRARYLAQQKGGTYKQRSGEYLDEVLDFDEFPEIDYEWLYYH